MKTAPRIFPDHYRLNSLKEITEAYLMKNIAKELSTVPHTDGNLREIMIDIYQDLIRRLKAQRYIKSMIDEGHISRLKENDNLPEELEKLYQIIFDMESQLLQFDMPFILRPKSIG